MTDGKPVLIRVISIVLVSVLTTLLLVSFALAKRDITQYPSNFSIGGISLGNCSQTEARDRLQAYDQSKWEHRLQLRAKGQEKVFLLPFDECGITYDLNKSLAKAHAAVQKGNGLEALFHPIIIRGTARDIPPVMIVSDRQKLYKSLDEIKMIIDQPAIDARVIVKNDSFEYIAHHKGHVIDMEASMLSIQTALSNGSVGPVDMITREVSPKIKMEDVTKVKNMIAVFVVDLNKKQVGNNDMAKLISRINGTIIMPGDQLTKEKLLQQSKVLFNEEKDTAKLEDGSAFLYDQIFRTFARALLENQGSQQGTELQVRNESQDPVLFALEIDEQKLIIKVFGRQQEVDREVLLKREEKVIPYAVEFRVDKNLDAIETLVQQTGKNGKKTDWYRVIKKKDRQLEKKLLAEDISQPENAIIFIGPGHSTK